MSIESTALTAVHDPSRPIGLVLHSWITTVDHKRLGILYILYALVFLMIGGIEATIMRIQLIVPHNHFVSPGLFNQMFTMHGTTMIFFVVMPVLFGFGNYLVPLMIGARDMAFPRVNAWSFWLTAFGGLLLYFSFVGGYGLYGAGTAPDVGWFAYAPLSANVFSLGHSTDFWTLGLLVSGFGSIGVAVNFVATIFCLRCPGMTLGKMPLLGWMFLVMAALVILAQLLIGGLTGIMLGSAPFNWQLSGSYFVVAHFHYVIVGAILFTVFGACYFWFPKITGRFYNEKLGKIHFWLFVIGFHLTFDFMHIPGILDMPRRIYTYEPGRGWEIWNLIVTIGVFFQIVGILVFVGNLLYSLFKGRPAGNDPWDAWTLEWSTSSPPPEYNFASTAIVNSRRPLWDIKHPEDPDWRYE
jgi:heme/copper-type cytochrome/quinol oxidase subunit 1